MVAGTEIDELRTLLLAHHHDPDFVANYRAKITQRISYTSDTSVSMQLNLAWMLTALNRQDEAIEISELIRDNASQPSLSLQVTQAALLAGYLSMQVDGKSTAPNTVEGDAIGQTAYPHYVVQCRPSTVMKHRTENVHWEAELELCREGIEEAKTEGDTEQAFTRLRSALSDVICGVLQNVPSKKPGADMERLLADGLSEIRRRCDPQSKPTTNGRSDKCEAENLNPPAARPRAYFITNYDQPGVVALKRKIRSTFRRCLESDSLLNHHIDLGWMLASLDRIDEAREIAAFVFDHHDEGTAGHGGYRAAVLLSWTVQNAIDAQDISDAVARIARQPSKHDYLASWAPNHIASYSREMQVNEAFIILRNIDGVASAIVRRDYASVSEMAVKVTLEHALASYRALARRRS